MSERMIARALAPLARSVRNLLARAVVSSVNAAGGMQVLQLRILAGELKDGVEHMEPYGLTAHPQRGAEAVAGFVEGDRSHGLVLMVADRRYRVTGLQAGEVCVYDDLGHEVRLTRAGIVIDGAAHQVTITNTPRLLVEGDIEATGEIKDRRAAGGKTMASMRATYNTHNHPGDSGGTTGTPNQGM